MTKFHAGGKNLNIIPGSASIGLDLRSQTNELMEELHERVTEILHTTSELYGVPIEVTKDYGIAAAEVSKDAQAYAHQAIVNVLGEEKANPPLVTAGWG